MPHIISIPVEHLDAAKRTGTGAAATGTPGTDVDSAGSAQATGFRGTVACNAAGISYRQLDYWDRTGLVCPSIRAARGTGSIRLYSFGDILMLQVVRRLLETGVSLPNVRAAVKHLRGIPTQSLAGITLLSDGVSVYACSSPEDITDIVRGGQGVFGIAIGPVWSQVQGDLAHFPAEPQTGEQAASDELAARRARRRTAS